MGVRLPPSRQEDLIMYLSAEFDYTEHRTRGGSYYTALIDCKTWGVLELCCLYLNEYRNETVPVLGFRLAF